MYAWRWKTVDDTEAKIQRLSHLHITVHNLHPLHTLQQVRHLEWSRDALVVNDWRAMFSTVGHMVSSQFLATDGKPTRIGTLKIKPLTHLDCLLGNFVCFKFATPGSWRMIRRLSLLKFRAPQHKLPGGKARTPSQHLCMHYLISSLFSDAII